MAGGCTQRDAHRVLCYTADSPANPAATQLTALEYTPGNDMDITQDMAADSEPGPVLLLPAPLPEPDCLPMLHVAVPHHPLSAEHVRKVRCLGVQSRVWVDGRWQVGERVSLVCSRHSPTLCCP